MIFFCALMRSWTTLYLKSSFDARALWSEQLGGAGGGGRRRVHPLSTIPYQSTYHTARCCAFRWIPDSVGFRRIPAELGQKSPSGKNVKAQSIGMHCNTIFLVAPVHSGWYLSMRFLQVEKARTYSK